MSPDKPKKEFKSCRDLHAWQVGHELCVSLDTALQEYRADAALHDWCSELQHSLRDAVVQVMEGFYKFGTADKIRRYEAAQFYIRRSLYTLELGQELGWWQLPEILAQTEQFGKAVRQTIFRLLELDKGKTDQPAAPAQS